MPICIALVHADAPPTRSADISLPATPVNDFATLLPGDKFLLDFHSIKRLTPDGNTIWSRSPDNSDPFVSPFFRHIIVSTDAYTFATGDTLNPFLGLVQRAWISKLSPSGTSIGFQLLSSDPDPPLDPFLLEMNPHVVADPSRNRIYTAFERFDFTFGPSLQIYARDATTLAAIANDSFSRSDANVELKSISVDADGSVRIAGYESIYTGGRQLFVLKYGPDLAGPPNVFRRMLTTQESGFALAAGVPSGDVVFAIFPSASGVADFLIRVDAAGNWSAPRQLPFFQLSTIAPDPSGDIYATGTDLVGGSRGIVKFDASNNPSWTPNLLALPSGRNPSFVFSPSDGVFDVVGTISSPAGTFISRYGGATAANSLVAIAPLDSAGNPGGIGEVETTLDDYLAVEVQDANGTPQAGVPISFSITDYPVGATGHRLVNPDIQTNTVGRAFAPFIIGNLPFKYEVTASCPSCSDDAKAIAFQVCSKYSVLEYSQFDFDTAEDVLDHHSMGHKIANRGCSLTAFTMMLNVYRDRYGFQYPHRDPRELNKLVSAPDTYSFVPDANLSYAPAIRAAVGSSGARIILDQLNDLATTKKTLSQLYEEVDDRLKSGDVPILKIKSTTPRLTHFIVVVGKCGTRYLIADPAGRQRKTFDPATESNILLATYIYRRGT